MTNLLTWRYWFTLRPEALSPIAQKGFIFLLILFAALAIILALAKRRGGLYRGLFKRLYNFFISNAVIGLIILFFNYEVVPFFSARFWIAIWAIVMLVWLAFIIKKIKTIPLQKKQKEHEQEFKKYLP